MPAAEYEEAAIPRCLAVTFPTKRQYPSNVQGALLPLDLHDVELKEVAQKCSYDADKLENIVRVYTS